MSKEAMKLALEALDGIYRYGLDALSGRSDGPDDRDWQRAGVNEMTKRARFGITALKALAEQPAQQDIPDLIAGTLGVSRGTAYDMMREALAGAQQEPVAWISTGPARMIHWTSDKPAYGDDWIPLYATPLPCPTCEALARTVMMDQTGRDA